MFCAGALGRSRGMGQGGRREEGSGWGTCVYVGLRRKLSTEELMLLSCVLEKTLESPLDCKEINQSILKEISPECSLEGLMLKLKKERKRSYRRKLNWSASRSFLRHPRLCLPSLSPVGGVERDTKGVLITFLHCLDLRSLVCSD